MGVNSEAVYGTRPWKIFGTGLSVQAPGGAMNERNRKPMSAADVRFTTKGRTLYAFLMGWPEAESVLEPLGTASAQSPGRIRGVELLGSRQPLKWTQEAAGLRVQMPAEKPCDHAVVLKVLLT